MEASHPTRDASITRVINARASHRCTRSLEIGLFNGKACNDPRSWRGETKKKKEAYAREKRARRWIPPREKKKLYSFTSTRLFLSLFLQCDSWHVLKVKKRFFLGLTTVHVYGITFIRCICMHGLSIIWFDIQLTGVKNWLSTSSTF